LLQREKNVTGSRGQFCLRIDDGLGHEWSSLLV
jgi:hypothetical protein